MGDYSIASKFCSTINSVTLVSVMYTVHTLGYILFHSVRMNNFPYSRIEHKQGRGHEINLLKEYDINNRCLLKSNLIPTAEF